MHYKKYTIILLVIFFIVGCSSSNVEFPTVNTDSRLFIVNHDVRFTSQAPFADWDDPRQQEGCEEASVYMAINWINGTSFTKQEALENILKMYDYEVANYGTIHDLSIEDTVKILFDEVYDSSNARAVRSITPNDIIKELYAGNLVLVPVNGQKLNNPNFTAPGPAYHMMVIKGYDPHKKLFITNDPGTRKGENYKYPYDVLEQSLQYYDTGFHVPYTEGVTGMIVVSKTSLLPVNE